MEKFYASVNSKIFLKRRGGRLGGTREREGKTMLMPIPVLHTDAARQGRCNVGEKREEVRYNEGNKGREKPVVGGFFSFTWWACGKNSILGSFVYLQDNF